MFPKDSLLLLLLLLCSSDFFSFFIFSFQKHQQLFKNEIEPSNECFLPFVTEPCSYDHHHLWRTFSINSTEIRRTCDLSSSLLIFTTLNIESFLIDGYFDQIIPRSENMIEKLIVDLKPITVDVKLTLKFPIWIRFIEIPLNNVTFSISYIKDSLFYSKRQNTTSGKSFLFGLLPSVRTVYHNMIIDNGTLHTSPLPSEFFKIRDELNLCGNDLACLNENPCLFVSPHRLLCDVYELNLELVFRPEFGVTKYETVFLNVYQKDPTVVHLLNRTSFITNSSVSPVTFAMNNLVIIMRAGNLTIGGIFFCSSDEIHVRIEHAGCNNDHFLIIIDPDVQMKPIQLINYKSREKEEIRCFLDYNK